MRNAIGIGVLSLAAFASIGAGPAARPIPVPVAEPSTEANPQFAHTYVLHLPGIAGYKWVDRQMTEGLREAGYTGPMDVYDWTGKDPGLSALMAYKRNHVEAQKIADMIVARHKADPSARIILTAHSGGTGLAVWALEKLPPDVKVDSVLLLASALSPEYDLTPALTHVTGKLYSFYSENDVLVLGAGTKMFGTIDGKKSESAGEFGFIQPDTADAKQYQKLVQKPYDRTWIQYGNIGDHIGPMRRPFSAHILAPLLFKGLIHDTANAEQPAHKAAAGQTPKRDRS